MGRKFTIPYALYRAHGFVNPFLADKQDSPTMISNSSSPPWKTPFSSTNRRPAQPGRWPCGFIVFKHDSQLGKVPSHALFDRVEVKRKDESKPARAFSDYELTIKEPMPEGVTLIRRI